MSHTTAEMNDYAAQAILKPAAGGGYHLTVTDGIDVVVLKLGDRGIGQLMLALARYQPEDPLPGLLEIDALSSDVRSSAMTAHPAGKGGVS